MNPCRLIYKSVASEDILTPSQLSKLANDASSNNRRLGLYGLLAVSNGKFLQLLEGPSKFVNELFCNIVKDPRHHDVELISFESIVHPEFIDWSMALLELDKIDESLQDFLRKKYPLKNDQFEFPNESFLMTSFLMDLKYILSDR